jgi:hypothetical protein
MTWGSPRRPPLGQLARVPEIVKHRFPDNLRGSLRIPDSGASVGAAAAVLGPRFASEKSSFKSALPLASIWIAFPIRGPRPDSS